MFRKVLQKKATMQNAHVSTTNKMSSHDGIDMTVMFQLLKFDWLCYFPGSGSKHARLFFDLQCPGTRLLHLWLVCNAPLSSSVSLCWTLMCQPFSFPHRAFSFILLHSFLPIPYYSLSAFPSTLKIFLSFQQQTLVVIHSIKGYPELRITC